MAGDMGSGADMAGDVANDMEGDVDGDISNTGHLWMGPI